MGHRRARLRLPRTPTSAPAAERSDGDRPSERRPRRPTRHAFRIAADVNIPEIVIDPRAGLLIGERTLTSSDQGAIPVGTVEQFTAVVTAVVDSAP